MKEYDVSQWTAEFIKAHTEDCLIILKEAQNDALQCLHESDGFRALRGYIRITNALTEFCAFDEDKYKIHLCRSYFVCGTVAAFGLGGDKGKSYAEYALQQAVDVMEGFFRQDINPLPEMLELHTKAKKLLRELYYNKDMQKLQKKYCPSFPHILL